MPPVRDTPKPDSQPDSPPASPVMPQPPPPTSDPNSIDFRPGASAPTIDAGALCEMCEKRGKHECRVIYRVPGVPTITRIPRGSRLTISMLPHNVEIISGMEVFKEFTPTLDPGKYRYTICRVLNPKTLTPVWRVNGEFLYDLTAEQYKRMANLFPRLAQGIATSDGPRWVCGFVGCGQRFTNVVQVIQHEGEHFGRDFLHETDEEALEIGAADIALAAKQHLRLKQAQAANQSAAPFDVTP